MGYRRVGFGAGASRPARAAQPQTERRIKMAAGIKLTQGELERAARMYHTAADAGRALGVDSHSFKRACRRFGILPPENPPGKNNQK